MPRLPDAIRVRVGPGEQEWEVRNVGKCRACSADIYWCQTLNFKTCPVDTEPDDEGIYVSHFATCPAASTFRGTNKSQANAVSGRDRAAGERD